MSEKLPWAVLDPFVMVAAAWLGCVGNPMSGLSFACDPDGTSTCSSGYVCVRNKEGSDPPGVCTPIGSLDAGTDTSGPDEGAVDPGIHDQGPWDGEPDDGEDIAEDCPPYWTCETWSVCGCENTQQRTCHDENGCTPGEGPKVEHQECDHCGNGACDCDETSDTCPMDCLPTVCGETTCPVLAGYLAGCHETKGTCEYTMGPGPDMIWIPAGPFWMGANTDDSTCSDNALDASATPAERPCHLVNVPAFWIDKFEVTVDAYGACVTAEECPQPTVSSPYCNWGKEGMGMHPMNCITWHEARGYCESVGKRLCSESEWEKAARGTDGRIYPWGNETATCEQHVVADEGGNGCGKGTTGPVGEKLSGASPYGVLDLSGNVWEWVEDDWHSDYNGGVPTDGSAWFDDPRADDRVLRGAGFQTNVGSRQLHSSFRYSRASDNVYVTNGARCCRSR